MSKRSAVKPGSEAVSDAEIVSAFQRGMVEWATAIDAHKMAPPDAGFAARLAALARGAHEAAQACLQAGVAGFEWPSARKEDSAPPYELRPETGRRGPDSLWRRFDRAVLRLRTVAGGTDMVEVAHAYEEIAAVADELAQAVETEDRANGAAPSRTRAHARRSA